MTACASCGVALGELTEEKKAKLRQKAENADRLFDAAIIEAEKVADKLTLELSTTRKLTGTDKDKSKNAFSLPAGPKFSCPGATIQCGDCYARTGFFLTPDQRKFYAQNWARWRYLEVTDPSGDSAAYELMQAILRSCSSYGHPQVFRLWESGDFHSQWSVNVWTKVMAQMPIIMFWGYTRSFNFDYSAMLQLKNLQMWASTDQLNYDRAAAFVRKYPIIKHAYWWDPLVPAPSGSFVCPATQPADVYIKSDSFRVRSSEFFKVRMKMPLNGFPEKGYAPGACGTCRYCLPAGSGGMYGNTRKSSVTFLDHEATKDAAVANAYKRLRLFSARGEANLITKGRSEEVEKELLAAKAETERQLEAERLRRQEQKREARVTTDKPAGTGLSGLGQTTEKGLVDGCMYSYGRPDHFPG